MVTRILPLAVLVSLAGCASGGHPTPDAIFRHPITGDVQWCDKPSGAALAMGGAIVAASVDYPGCKSNWESKGYVRLDSTAKLSPENQQRYEDDLQRKEQARADSIRPK